jgi:hypothetical protein
MAGPARTVGRVQRTSTAPVALASAGVPVRTAALALLVNTETSALVQVVGVAVPVLVVVQASTALDAEVGLFVMSGLPKL